MKRILLGIGIVALLTTASSAWADGFGWGGVFGPVVRWDRIEGVFVLPDGSGMKVGPLQGSARYRLADGKAE
jgi:hypothetical protein